MIGDGFGAGSPCKIPPIMPQCYQRKKDNISNAHKKNFITEL